MCFSATASFTSFAILSAAGAAGVKFVQKPSQYFFSSIPFLFATQQFVEGLVWLGIIHHYQWKSIAVHLFIFFAQVVWAIWVPLSILKMERFKLNIRILKSCLGIGIILACYISWCLFFYPVNALINDHHINYKLYFPHQYYPVLGLLYLIPIIVPPLASSIPEIKLIGILLFCSFVLTKWFYNDEVISVWCFFAAIISSIVYWVLRNHYKLNQRMNSGNK